MFEGKPAAAKPKGKPAKAPEHCTFIIIFDIRYYLYYLFITLSLSMYIYIYICI